MSVLQFQTSWWDILPLEIQLYIRQLADRAHHQDQLRIIHEVIERFWDICDCGPFHVLREIYFSKKWRIACGMYNFLRSRHYKGSQRRVKYLLHCRYRRTSDED